MGFLHGRPKEYGNGLNRWQKFEKDFGREPPLPEVNEHEYLFDTFLHLGMVSNNGEKDIPLLWTEIAAFKSCTGLVATPWELSMLHQMSKDYLSGRFIGNDVFADPPED